MTNRVQIPITDTLIDVSASYGHLRCFHDLLPLIVRSNPHTYISNSDPSDPLRTTWLELALVGLENLRRRTGPQIQDVAVIGTGGGLDAVGISHIFAPESIIASDIHPRALDAARWNVARFARPQTRCELRQSDLFRDYPVNCDFDLVYENLPNIPDGEDLLDGLRAASCYRPASYRADLASDLHLLTLHHACLLEARDHLRPHGWVVSMIGGRVPWPVIAGMFVRAGYQPVLYNFGLKTQTEPALVLPGYARAEQEGSPPFAFYHPVEACAGILAGGTTNGECDWEARAGLINAGLESCRVSAGEALRLHQQGERVCHSVYVVGGTPAE